MTKTKTKKLSGISAWPADDRPREKLLKKGVRSLSNSELLAILLRTETSGVSAIDLARGNNYLKSVLKSAALSAIRTKNSSFSIKYKEMLSQGKKPTIACLSVAGSIASTMWSIWRSGEQYDNNKYKLRKSKRA